MTHLIERCSTYEKDEMCTLMQPVHAKSGGCRQVGKIKKLCQTVILLHETWDTVLMLTSVSDLNKDLREVGCKCSWVHKLQHYPSADSEAEEWEN